MTPSTLLIKPPSSSQNYWPRAYLALNRWQIAATGERLGFVCSRISTEPNIGAAMADTKLSREGRGCVFMNAAVPHARGCRQYRRRGRALARL
jgi:hypothetical protein